MSWQQFAAFVVSKGSVAHCWVKECLSRVTGELWNTNVHGERIHGDYEYNFNEHCYGRMKYHCIEAMVLHFCT